MGLLKNKLKKLLVWYGMIQVKKRGEMAYKADC